MDFKEFYKLLDEAITKEPSDVTASEDNYNSFIFNMMFKDENLNESVMR